MIFLVVSIEDISSICSSSDREAIKSEATVFEIIPSSRSCFIGSVRFRSMDKALVRFVFEVPNCLAISPRDNLEFPSWELYSRPFPISPRDNLEFPSWELYSRDNLEFPSWELYSRPFPISPCLYPHSFTYSTATFLCFLSSFLLLPKLAASKTFSR